MNISTELSNNTATTTRRAEIAFVLDNLPDFETLVLGLRPGVQVVVLGFLRA